MNKKKKFSLRTSVMLLVAIMLLLGGTMTATRAVPNIFSNDYIAWFYMDHLQVHLLENGKDVCDGHNDLDGSSKVTGPLATDLGYSVANDGTETLGKVKPGKVYKEEIAAKNGQDIGEYVRLTVRKYWVDPKTGEKTTVLHPKYIKLKYNDSDYNTSAWQINDSETTTESATYYYSSELDPGAETELLFNKLVIDGKVAEIGEVKETKEGSKTIYTWEYKYDGYTFYIEADVQAIQTHNVNDAIHSQWGVYNVTAGDGSLTVSN